MTTKTVDKNLKIRFTESIHGELMKTLGIKNPMAVPKVSKIIVNVGVSKSDSSTKDIETVKAELATITGQAPKVAGAKQSIAGFKIRAGDPVGVSVTLRGQKMFDFLDKLCRIVLPQVKDFRGVKSTAFDHSGNYTLGLTEQIIFPEIDYAKVEKVHGMEIVIVTTTKNDEHAYALLKAIGMPFEKKTEENN
jgi:large subunit ribosomal protein L5